MATLLLAIALTAPTQAEAIHFDRIDIHHCYCADSGEVRFRQLIFWRWCREGRRFYSFGFKIVKDDTPLPRFNGQHWTVELKRNSGHWRITADFLIEWHSSYDPEAIDRQRFPEIQREW